MDWPHAPLHRFKDAGIYMVTGATYQKINHYRSPSDLDELQRLLFAKATQYDCSLQAWTL